MGSSFHIRTFGCKLNQFDSAAVEADLRARGLATSHDHGDASVVVINTCTVTHRADADARRLARRVRRENPGCLVVATGCLAERDPEALEALEEIDLVVGRLDRPRLGELVAARAEGRLPGMLTGPGEAPSCAGGLSFGDRTRAFLKVQEGCALACAYCIIPQVRGRSTSVPPDQVATGLESLLRAGYREVVLTGVNTGDYGADLSPRTDLAALLRRLLRTPGLGRLRLNSLEPRTVTEEILDLLAGDEKLAPHLQVPLQSGSDRVLGFMRRNYRASLYARVVEAIRRRVPHAGLGADVIVGHPGEGEAQFQETVSFLASSPLNYLHVFSYSPRPGTAAAGRDDHVDPAVIARRSERLREMAAAMALRFRRSFVGRGVQVLAYDTRRADGRLRGLTGNFIDVGLDAPDGARNRLLDAVLTHAGPDGALARPA
jgi:threonylcarbamoyladenosine tRNA methylthiotransferase MtaB